MHAGSGAGGAARVVDNATARRNWTAGQSSVFDSSGSSSSDEQGKPRGLRGVRVLDQQNDGGAGTGGGRANANSVGNNSRDPGGLSPSRSHADVRPTGGSAATTGERPNTFTVPRLDTLKGIM